LTAVRTFVRLAPERLDALTYRCGRA